MSVEPLEVAYRRWLRVYPAWFRREHETEMLEVLLANARPGRDRPEPGECLTLVLGAISLRLRPRLARDDRATFAAVRLSYLGAVMQVAVAATVLATAAQVRARILVTNPRFGNGQWLSLLTGSLQPLALVAGLAALMWALTAWLMGRRHRGAYLLLIVNVVGTTASLVHGVVGGAATYATTDLTVGILLWLVEIAAVGAVLVDQRSRGLADHEHAASV